MSETYLCRKCNIEKDISEFRILKSGKVNSWCKSCHNLNNILIYRIKNGLDTNLEHKYKKTGIRTTYKCDICNNEHKSEKLREKHYNTNKHKKNIEKNKI